MAISRSQKQRHLAGGRRTLFRWRNSSTKITSRRVWRHSSLEITTGPPGVTISNPNNALFWANHSKLHKNYHTFALFDPSLNRYSSLMTPGRGPWPVTTLIWTRFHVSGLQRTQDWLRLREWHRLCDQARPPKIYKTIWLKSKSSQKKIINIINSWELSKQATVDVVLKASCSCLHVWLHCYTFIRCCPSWASWNSGRVQHGSYWKMLSSKTFKESFPGPTMIPMMKCL